MNKSCLNCIQQMVCRHRHAFKETFSYVVRVHGIDKNKEWEKFYECIGSLCKHHIWAKEDSV